VLTSERLIQIEGETQHAVGVSQPLRKGPVTMLAVSNGVLVGRDVGEWGGGLSRIDPATGVATAIEHREDWACGGLLNSRCHPVHALAPSPRPGCIVAAVGLYHLMMSDGRLVEVCGDEVRELYAEPLRPPPVSDADRAAGREYYIAKDSTTAFYDVVLSGRTLWAWGDSGLYRLDGDRMDFLGMPQMEAIGEYRVSFAIPGIVVVGLNTDSPVGATPRLAPR
jgi:hypothetical protein